MSKGKGTGNLDVMVRGLMPQLTEGILNVGGAEGGLEVLLVGEDEEGDVLVVLVLHRPPQLHLGLVQPLLLGAVHHEDDPVRAPRVAPPQRPQLVLPADVPHRERRAQPGADLRRETS